MSSAWPAWHTEAGAGGISVGRWARLCLEHGAVLVERDDVPRDGRRHAGEGLRCPRGHEVNEWQVLDRLTGEVRHRVDGEEVVAMRGRARPREEGGPQTRRLEVAKFHSGGAVLFVWSEREERPGGARFAVRWQMRRGEGKGPTQNGTVWSGAEAGGAEAAFRAELARAGRDGWVRVEAGAPRRGSRHVPPPPKAARGRRRARA